MSAALLILLESITSPACSANPSLRTVFVPSLPLEFDSSRRCCGERKRLLV